MEEIREYKDAYRSIRSKPAWHGRLYYVLQDRDRT